MEVQGGAGGHDLRVGVKGGVKKETHWVTDRDLLMISWMSPVQEGSWEAPGRQWACCAPVPYLQGLHRQVVRSARF